MSERHASLYFWPTLPLTRLTYVWPTFDLFQLFWRFRPLACPQTHKCNLLRKSGVTRFRSFQHFSIIQNKPFVFLLGKLTKRVAIPVANHRSAQGPGPESAPRTAFWVIFRTWLGVPQRVLFECFLALLGQKDAESTQKTLFGALRARCRKSLKKRSMGHFQTRAPGHSCEWRPGSQENRQDSANLGGGGVGLQSWQWIMLSMSWFWADCWQDFISISLFNLFVGDNQKGNPPPCRIPLPPCKRMSRMPTTATTRLLRRVRDCVREGSEKGS